MKCQDRDCTNPAEGSAVLVQIGEDRGLALVIEVCPFHRRKLEIALGPYGDRLTRMNPISPWWRAEEYHSPRVTA